mgnify:CR=1 FL=1
MDLVAEAEQLRDCLEGRRGWRTVMALIERLKDLTFERDAMLYFSQRAEHDQACEWIAGWHEGYTVGQLSALAGLLEAYEAATASPPTLVQHWAHALRATGVQGSYAHDLC